MSTNGETADLMVREGIFNSMILKAIHLSNVKCL